ncbi:MAG: hypothetical protein ACOCP4_04580 [Candidatus Woesearchaeota archaeon]
MAENDWTTTSVKLERDLKMKLIEFCEREKITPNKLIKSLIKDKLEFMLKPSIIRKDQGIPVVGKHEFEYDALRDTFSWSLDLGHNNKHMLSNNVSEQFLKSLSKEIEQALNQKEQELTKLKNKSPIPSDILKFEVKK